MLQPIRRTNDDERPECDRVVIWEFEAATAAHSLSSHPATKVPTDGRVMQNFDRRSGLAAIRTNASFAGTTTNRSSGAGI